jgi:hypothetical protein
MTMTSDDGSEDCGTADSEGNGEDDDVLDYSTFDYCASRLL